jgi:hypothetical protein
MKFKIGILELIAGLTQGLVQPKILMRLGALLYRLYNRSNDCGLHLRKHRSL